MKRKNVLLLLLGTLTVSALYPDVSHALTPDFTMQFNLRETPGDPMSDITHTITLGLMKDTVNGDDIGWEVAILTIRELDENGDVVDRWSMADPFVDTTDNLWWITHADPDNPVNSEFALPPRIHDTAPSPDAGVSDLDFDFQGNVYEEPPGGPPFDDTGSLDSFLRLAESPPPPPKKDVTKEPVEIPFEPEDAYPST